MTNSQKEILQKLMAEGFFIEDMSPIPHAPAPEIILAPSPDALSQKRYNNGRDNMYYLMSNIMKIHTALNTEFPNGRKEYWGKIKSMNRDELTGLNIELLNKITTQDNINYSYHHRTTHPLIVNRKK
jgi:hypothetical protein